MPARNIHTRLGINNYPYIAKGGVYILNNQLLSNSGNGKIIWKIFRTRNIHLNLKIENRQERNYSWLEKQDNNKCTSFINL